MGSEFRVPETATDTQSTRGGRSVSTDASGNFVVVWQVAEPPDRWKVRGRRFDHLGAPLGAEFGISGSVSMSSPSEPSPVVASTPIGTFVVSWWQQAGFYGQPPGIFARRYDPGGNPLGGEFRVNAAAPAVEAQFPGVAAGTTGNFVVVWEAGDGDARGISARFFNSAGLPIGGDLQVNSATTGDQYAAAVAAKNGEAAQEFVVVWLDSSPSRVMGQRFDSVGTRRGGEFQVSALTPAPFNRPSVAADKNSGNFVVGWARSSSPPASEIPMARRYDSSGNPVLGEFDVDAAVGGQPSVAVGTDGETVTVAWRGLDAQNGGIFGRSYDRLGMPLGPRFAINTYTTGEQELPAIAPAPGGSFVVAWTDWAQEGAGNKGVFARRFGGLRPELLQVDAAALPGSNGNGVLEAGETAEVAPGWRNVSGAMMALQGAASAFTGPGAPGDPTYSLPDAAANYGFVPAGTLATCAFVPDCYRVSTSLPTVRPAVHWDATLREDIAGSTQWNVWTLHFGDSFADVPRGSPFYRFIETLLHKGVTGGCSATQYCPSTATTRDQMAVFVLVAKEGTGYVPPACTTPVFADVPASSPFCRWIEELARRGVAGGCGTGLYCPTQAVTREQMAVFVLRTLDPALSPPACTTPVYNDVPASSGFCRWIEELTRRAVVGGCGGGNYCPTASVTREQMGVFLGVTFGLTLYGP